MFNSLEEAISFGEKKNQDGGRPEFYIEAVDYKDAEGNVASKDEVYVRIFNIGDPKNIIERPKRAEDEKRWPEYWKAFVEGTEEPSDGTPIKSFPLLTPADIANLTRRRIRTVEEIIDLPDTELNNIFGGKGFGTRKAAEKFLSYRKGDTAALLKRIEELEKKLGDDTGDVPKRASGNGVSKSVDTGGKQQSGRKANTGNRKKSGKKAGRGASVDDSV